MPQQQASATRPRRAGRAAAGWAPRSGGRSRHRGGSPARTTLTPSVSSRRSSWDSVSSSPRQFARRALAWELVSPRSTWDSIGADTPLRSARSRRDRSMQPHEGSESDPRMNRSSTPCVRYHLLLYVIVLGILAGCGGDDPDQPPQRGTKPSVLRAPGEAGLSTRRRAGCLRARTVGRVLGVNGLRARPNDSLDLTICEWQGGRVPQREALVDSAPRAQLRYYNLLGAARVPQRRPRAQGAPDQGRGQDSAYGGAGAWWTRHPPARGLRPRADGEGARERARVRRPRGARPPRSRWRSARYAARRRA